MDLPSGMSILGVCGVIIAGILKFRHRNNTSGNVYVRSSTCEARVEGFIAQLNDLKVSNHNISQELSEFRKEVLSNLSEMRKSS